MFEFINNFKTWFAESRSEFKKISWPSQDEIKGSTVVVCTTILFLMIVLASYDSVIAPCIDMLLKASK